MQEAPALSASEAVLWGRLLDPIGAELYQKPLATCSA